MDNFTNGTIKNVQVLDELGRWENAKIIDKSDSKVKVTYVGWRKEFDTWIDLSDAHTRIRKPISLCHYMRSCWSLVVLKHFFENLSLDSV